MRAFLDFEASSLGKHSYPIEVAWVFEDGSAESYLIKPAPDWADWDGEAEAIHHISRDKLLREGKPHDWVAHRMIETLSDHQLFATAPSWDGKWLSRLLRTAKYPRHRLRLKDSDIAHAETAREILQPILVKEKREAVVALLLAATPARAPDIIATHRALPDAQEERERWVRIKAAAEQLAHAHRNNGG